MASQILLFSQARSASHMLVRMFEKQDQLNYLRLPYSHTRGMQLEWMQSEHCLDGMAAETLAAFGEGIEKGTQEWRQQLSETEAQGKILMLHTPVCVPMGSELILRYFKSMGAGVDVEAPPYNCSLMPESLLLLPGTVPIFTIRDPRLTVSSTYCTLQKMGLDHGGGLLNFFTVTCPIWNRLMYDYYVSKGFNPFVIDADDFITSPDFVRLLCSRVRLDPEQLQFSWDAATEDERKEIHPMYYASQSRLIESSGPDSGCAGKNIDLEKEMEGWEQEFGDDAAVMKELVELARPYYEYLLEHKMLTE